MTRLIDRDPIKHVVVLMLENHSFDQMLGCFKSVYRALEGIDPDNLMRNYDAEDNEYVQAPATEIITKHDPMHEHEHVMRQLENNHGGFVSDYANRYQNTDYEDRLKIMSYFEKGSLRALHTLAENFAICDHWFSSVPGPTCTNRFFLLSGTSNGIVEMATHLSDVKHYLCYTQESIFDRLNERKIYWRVYFGDVPQSLMLVRQITSTHNNSRYRPMHNFFADTEEDESTFPQFVFIEPRYLEVLPNDDHPTHSNERAQRLIAHIYNAMRKNDELWKSTLFIVLYDEHGGFYDHVPPPPAIPPGDGLNTEFTFDSYGVRVPAVICSPWIEPQLVTTIFDHTSVLKYLTEKWNLRPLGDRVQSAANFAADIQIASEPRPDTPRELYVPWIWQASSVEAAAEDDTLNDLQKSLVVFTENLAGQEHRISRAATAMAATPVRQSEIARDRVSRFLDQESEKAANRHGGASGT
ncbi:MAG TPA: alkaline phosphatase family protein [Lacipirellulaceae bacterium]